jgi:hypothetical protein
MGDSSVQTIAYQQHIDSLASEHGVEVAYSSNASGRAWRRTRRVRTPEIKSAVTYALALHEFGHVVGYQRGLRIDLEAQAWRWAEANAIEWTEPMIRKAGRCIASYLKACERRRNMSVPPADHDAWKIAQWA